MDWKSHWKVLSYSGVAAAFLSTVGCSSRGNIRLPSDRGYVEFSGDAQGVHALMDGFNGLITNGKASADTKDTPYYEQRRKQESEYTLRETSPGFLGKLFGQGGE